MPKNIFFDLDHTIWDFDTNSQETLKTLYEEYKMQFITPCDVNEFIKIYTRVNHDLWALYRQNRVTKEELRHRRFLDTFTEMKVYEEDMPQDMETAYIAYCPTKTALMPGAIETLKYLSQNYDLHIITNGFAESQRTKLKCSNLAHYFKTLTISEEVGAQKPHAHIFNSALKNAGSSMTVSHYIGDNLEADVKGAIDSGWQAYWYTQDHGAFQHPQCTAIKSLLELKHIF
jgi:putative hydrolase of the HAD superfamily